MTVPAPGTGRAPRLVPTAIYHKAPPRRKQKSPGRAGKASTAFHSRKRAGKYLSVGDHLEELRRRLIVILLTILAISLFALAFSRIIHGFLIAPYLSLTRNTLLLQNVYGSLEVLLKIGIMSGITLGMPVCFFILWGFITPALNRRVNVIGHISVIASAFLFWSGLAVAWYYIFPLALNFLFQDMLLEGVSPQTSVEKYYSFLFLLHIGCGLAFQMPLLTVVLGWLGILPISWHKRRWKFVILFSLLFSALITPPDPVSQLVLAALLLGLYAISVFCVWVLERMH